MHEKISNNLMYQKSPVLSGHYMKEWRENATYVLQNVR
jgi:hypothetical protein